MYYILRLINISISLFPRKLALKFGRFFGFFIYTICPIRKNIAEKNISLAFPDLNNSEKEYIIKKCYKHYGMVLVDFLRMPILNKKNIKNIFSFDSQTIELLNSLSGGIVMTGHIGNWEMIIPGFGLNNFHMGIVTQTQRSKGAQKFFNWIRRKENTTLIPKKASKKIMMDVLDNNKFLGLASDQNAGKNGVNVPFFNSKVSTPKGAGYFHIKTKKTILIGFCILKPNLKYELTLKEIDEHIISNKKNDFIYNVNTYFSQLLENQIKEYPEQYFWFHKKWDKKIY